MLSLVEGGVVMRGWCEGLGPGLGSMSPAIIRRVRSEGAGGNLHCL